MAEGEAIADDGLPLGFCVRNDVGGIEKLVMPESAKRALVPIGSKHSFSERSLVQATPRLSCDVSPACVT
jgi:hypothetical protein